MANDEHLALLWQGVKPWNAWCAENPTVKQDLDDADLRGASLSNADLSGASLIEADLSRAVLRAANLRGTDLRYAMLGDANLNDADLSDAQLSDADFSGATLDRANLSGASLVGADLSRARLFEAHLSDADLRYANLSGANLSDADFSDAHIFETVLGNVDLTETKGLDSCVHLGPSIVDQRNLEHSANVSFGFWRGCGLPDWQIATIKLYQPNLSQADINDVTDEIFRLRAEQPIQLYSCFISYSSDDRAFARRLHDDLQNAGVRLWFDEHDLKTGDRLRDEIDRAIRTRDKLLLIFSEASIAGEWVENEVETALEEERSSSRRKTILFPIRIDDAVMETKLPWARMIKRDRHITDMAGWKKKAGYQKGLERLLSDLRSDPEGCSPWA